MPKLSKRLLPTLVLTAFLLAIVNPVLVSAKDFKDVPSDHKAKVAIDYLVDRKIISGFGDDTFKPDAPFSRAQAVKVIIDGLDLKLSVKEGEILFNAGDTIRVGSQEIKVDQNNTKLTYVQNPTLPDPTLDPMLKSLKDLEPGAWYLPYIQKGIRLNLVKGRDDGTFGPNEQLSLAAMLTVLARASKLNDPGLNIDLTKLPTYIDRNSWYAEGIAFGLQEKLIGIAEGKRLAPFYLLSRSEAIIIIYNYIVLNEEKLEQLKEQPEKQPEAVNNTTSSSTDNSKFIGFSEEGVASYYGKSSDGANTASGEKLDNTAFQAAHKTLPFNTVVKLTNTENGKWVKARIVDRGPHVDGRIVDLTTSAFEALAELSRGVVKVKLEVDTLP
jgi:rare lipoprotein A